MMPLMQQVFLRMQRMKVRRYRGASGFISIHNFSIAEHRDQQSAASIWIENGPHYMVLGWMVIHSLPLNIYIVLLTYYILFKYTQKSIFDLLISKI